MATCINILHKILYYLLHSRHGGAMPDAGFALVKTIFEIK
jgi:hypothetical protein